MKITKKALEKQSKAWLVDRLLELSQINTMNADRIAMSLISETENEPAIIAKFQRQIDKAVENIEEHGPGSWDSQLPGDDFDCVVDALTGVLAKNMLNAVVKTCEYALIKLDCIFELQDECELEYLVDAFIQLHLEACQRSRPDPIALGTRLAELCLQTEWEFFDGPPAGYADILGQEGLTAYITKRQPAKAR